MLYEFILQLSMNIDVTDFYMHGEKIIKLCRHLVINLRKRFLPLVRTNMLGLSLAVILNDHVVHDHTSLHHLPWFFFELGRDPKDPETALFVCNDSTNYI
jgi:hypothetical protein